MRPIHPTRTNHGAELPPAPVIVEAADGGAYVCDRPGEATGDRFRYIAPPARECDAATPPMRLGSHDAAAEPFDGARASLALARGVDVYFAGAVPRPTFHALWCATLAELNTAFDASYRVWPLDPAIALGDSGSLHEVFAESPLCETVQSFEPNASPFDWNAFGDDWAGGGSLGVAP